ncbi:MAG: flavocytochrome [Burkholderiaceae bacterium]|jgi:NADPH-dependent 2,4-dienoyl-CoA reductase/sulfur reductase-like enzyme|nr:flavocytochrome [Burkholderiaceae bacterium]
MNTKQLSRRDVLKALSAAAAAGTLSACATMEDKKTIGKVVVVGAGYGGATAAKYLRMWSGGAIDVTLVDPNEAFISCPISNLVLGGSKTMADITVSYGGLDKYGVKRVRDTVTAIDADKKQVRLASGGTLSYDRLVVSPGIEFMYDRLQGWSAAGESTVLHAWKAGPQTVALRRQLTELKDGGVIVMAIPLAPYRCPPGPYERTCQIGWYLKQAKPKSKLIVLDANPDYVSKKPLFSRVFGDDYKGIVDYRVASPVTEIDLKTNTLVTEIGDRVRGDVLNYIPAQRAANIARDAGLITANNRWCEVDWTTMESIKVKGVHVLGDATLSAPAMPKSGHMANQHGKAAAAAIVELLNGRPVTPPMMANTCYSFIDDKNAVHVASVHRWVPEKKTLEVVAGSSGISTQDRASWALEGAYANGWAQTIWADMLA